MHEYGLAADIVHGVQREAEAEGGRRLGTLEVEVGALARLETDTLSFWLAEELADHLDDPSIDADRIHVHRVPLRLVCRSCAHAGEVAADEDGLVLLDAALRKCTECGSADVTVEGDAGWQIRVAWADENT